MTTIATLSVGSSKMSFTAAAAAVDNVPARMQLSRSIKQALTSSSSSPSLYEAPLIPLTLNNKESLVREEQDDIQSLQQVALQQKGPSVAFILRRPGWVLCREHGRQLSKLAAASSSSSVQFWGVVKETGVDDRGLLDFHNDHYPFPLYRDETLATYAALGTRKLKLTTWNPIRLYKGYRAMTKRLKAKKNLTGNLVGEGMVQGGIFLFDKEGTLRYAYEEETGSEFEMQDIEAAMQKISTTASQ